MIVNYNGARFLRNCLDALRQQTYPACLFEVIVVDNGSKDESALLIQQEYPEVHLVLAGQNLGFALGNHAGANQARGEWYLFLNNDTIADPFWLEGIAGACRAFPNTGIFASKLVFSNQPTQLNSTGLDLWRDGHGQDRGYLLSDCGQYEKEEEVFASCGAALAIRRDCWNKLGGFDSRHFMYYEDLDLCWRAHFLGIGTTYLPQSLVQHVHCGSTGEWSPFFTYYVERNRIYTCLKNGDLWLGMWTCISLLSRLRKAALNWFKALIHNRPDRQNKRELLFVYISTWIGLLLLLPGVLWQRHRYRFRFCLANPLKTLPQNNSKPLSP